MLKNFKNDIEQGLNTFPKTLPSKYFYDETGDELFIRIMALPEYYLTRCELDIFANKTEALVDVLELNQEPKKDSEQRSEGVDIIELGAGDGTKTKELLRFLDDKKFTFDYFPIDISNNALSLLQQNIESELPSVSIKPKQGDYFEILESLKLSQKPKIVLFLGSNIGNMHDDLATQFLSELSDSLEKGDKLLLGVDLIKPEDIVLPAYHDNQGVTAQFNLNLLERINKELSANFDVSKFSHQPEYDEQVGVAKSFIVSTCQQSVHIEALNTTIDFDSGERIHTEISRKYNDEILQNLIQSTDFKIENKLLDSKQYFANYVLTKR